MASQLWHVARGRRLSSPHSCSPIWNGGERTTILCVPTNHFEWRSYSYESEGANERHSAIGNGRKLRLRAEPIDDGQRARCSLAPCQRFPLERHKARCGCRVMLG